MLQHSVHSVFAIATTSLLFAGSGSLLDRSQASAAQISQAPSSATVLASSSKSYPAEVVQNFMTACVQGGATEQICACVLNSIQNRYSLQEFIQIELDYQRTGQMPQEIIDFTEACISQSFR